MRRLPPKPYRKERRAGQARLLKDPKFGPDGWTFVKGPLPDPHVFPALRKVHTVWLSARHVVLCDTRSTKWGDVEHITVQRHDDKPIREWSTLQRVKNAIAGADRVAVEVFPRDEDLVDDAHIYHLWVLPEGVELPFGLRGGRRRSEGRVDA